MKKIVIAICLLVLMASASVAQAYVFQLYDAGLHVTGTATSASFENLLTAPGTSTRNFYFSVVPSYTGTPAGAVGLELSYSFSGSSVSTSRPSWQASYTLAAVDTPTQIITGYSTRGGAGGSGSGSASSDIYTNTIYGLAILSKVTGTSGSADFKVNLSLPGEKPANTPIPAAGVLLGTGLLGLLGINKKRRA